MKVSGHHVPYWTAPQLAIGLVQLTEPRSAQKVDVNAKVSENVYE